MKTKARLEPSMPPGLTVKLVGLGGVGGAVARYLALFFAAQPQPSRLVLIDGDSFEPGNASRMLFGGFGNKATLTRLELLERLTDSALTVEAVPEYLAPTNIARLIRDRDVVLAAVDNHATRRLINDYCRRELADVCLISGGNDGLVEEGREGARRGTYGNVQVYWRREGRELTPDLTRYHREIETPADRLPSELSCTELANSVPQILFTNLAVASALLSTFWLWLCGQLAYDEVAFDIAEGRMRPIRYQGGAEPTA